MQEHVVVGMTNNISTILAKDTLEKCEGFVISNKHIFHMYETIYIETVEQFALDASYLN